VTHLENTYREQAEEKVRSMHFQRLESVRLLKDRQRLEELEHGNDESITE
jgi:hypothetical protein